MTLLAIADLDVEISKDVIVCCPIEDFKPRRAFRCRSCSFFAGLAVMGGIESFADSYAIRCTHVIERRTHNLEIIED